MWVEFLGLLWLALCSVESRRARDVKTTQGYARGYFAANPPHYAFMGLPYATVRTRFKAPGPPPRWDGIFEATHRVKCPQERSGEDNCLVVNVFVPEGAEGRPVLVFVHDGHFQNGWGAHRASSKLLKEGLVIVTFNYRLGPLGFLCLKIPEAPGNAGLKDQVSALYWVQMNIKRFGGNPSDVTVYGIGSGAAAVQILLLSGLTRGLIHKVILESGSVLSPTSLEYDPVAQAGNAAVKLGSKQSSDPGKLVKFFRKLPLMKMRNLTEVFLPCVEQSNYYVNHLLDEDPLELLRKGSYQKVPMIIIYSQTDGMSVVDKNKNALSNIPEQFDVLLPNNLRITDEQKRHRIGELVKQLYFTDDGEDLEESYVAYFHDVLYQYPIIKFGILYGEKSSHPVYVMKFMYKRKKKNRPLSQEKVIDYVYGDDLIGEDNAAADRLIGLLCNFIRLGDPTPITTSTVPVIWKSVIGGTESSSTAAAILQFDRTLTMTSLKRNQYLTFWRHVYDNFYRKFSMNEADLE